MDSLYQDIILDHAQHPRNFGAMEHPTHTIREMNASCGDMVEFYVLISNGVIQDVKWRGVGCAISTASASMVSELIKGKTVAEAKSITKEQVMEQMGLDSIVPTREKCLMLAIKVLQKISL